MHGVCWRDVLLRVRIGSWCGREFPNKRGIIFPSSTNGAPNVDGDLSALRDNWGAGDLDFVGNSGTGSVNDSQTMGIVGLRGITTTASGTNLTIALPQGTAANQVLKWDGTNWTPQADTSGGATAIHAHTRDGIQIAKNTTGLEPTDAEWATDQLITDNEHVYIRPDPDHIPRLKNFYITDNYGGISQHETPNGWHWHLASTRFCRQVDENGHFAPGTEWWNAPEQDVWTWGWHGTPYLDGMGGDNDQLWRITCYRGERGKVVHTDVNGDPVPGMPEDGRMPDSP